MKHLKKLFPLLILLTLIFGSWTLASEYSTSSPTKSLIPIAIGTSLTTTSNVESGAAHILFQSKDGGQTWQDISQGLPDNGWPDDFFAGESDLYLRVQKVMYRSKSNLKTPVWEKSVSPGKDWKQVQKSLAMNVVESEGVLIATDGKGIKRSTDKGEHWEWVISEGGVGIAVERIEGGFAAVSYSDITKSRRIRISLDNGKTWKAIDEGLPPSLSISSIKQVGNYLLCGHPDGIFRSSDMGKTWKVVLPGVDNGFKIFSLTANSTSDKNKKVFKLFVSGNVVYAVARHFGC